MTTINDYLFINQLEKYGKSVIIKKEHIRKINLLLSIIIPIIYPIPVAILINKIVIRKSIKIRY